MVRGDSHESRVGQVAIRIHKFTERIDAIIQRTGKWEYERNHLFKPAAEFAGIP